MMTTEVLARPHLSECPKLSQAWLPSLGDDLSELRIPLVAFIEFSGQRQNAAPLETHIKQMCNGIGNVLNRATKNAYYREGRGPIPD